MYSMLDSPTSIKEWHEWALLNGVPGFSVTDHGSAISLYEIIKFNQYTKEYNIKNNTQLGDVIGIPGIEFYIKINKEDKKHFHINAWALNNEGYKNLIRLSSLSFDDVVSRFGDKKPRICLEDLKNHMGGLAIGTACIGSPMGKYFMDGDVKEAESIYKTYIDIFGVENLYVEFHTSDLTHNFNNKTKVHEPILKSSHMPEGNAYLSYNNFLWDMVHKYGGNPIPATDAHFINPKDKIIQDILVKNGTGGHFYFKESYHQLSVDEQYEKLKNHLGDKLTTDIFSSWIENTLKISDAAKSIDIKYEYSLPKIEIPEHIKRVTDDYNKQTFMFLIEKIKEHGRWNNTEEYTKRFKKEIDVIMNNGIINLIPYFLVYEDICQFARNNGVTQGIARGSAGASIISYYLKIIHIDPIKNNLPFERFLSVARIKNGSFPDIDSDFSDRKPIVSYLQDKYGSGFSQISTFTRMKTKNAIKDAMRAIYQMPSNSPDVDFVCKTIPNSPQGVDEKDFLYGYTDENEVYHKGIFEENEALQQFFTKYPKCKDVVDKLVGVVRGWGRHASAFIVSTKNLADGVVPIMKMADPDLGMVPVTQYSGPMIEKCGLIKIDILVVKTIQAISDCISLIKERGGVDYLERGEDGVERIYRLPEDTSVYKDFELCETDTSFQFNTGLIKTYLPSFSAKKRSDLSALTALVRPGSLDAMLKLPNGEQVSATQHYMNVRSGKSTLTFLHDDLKNIVGDTNGVFCVAGGTKILLKNEIKNIEDVKPGDMVMTEDGTYQKVIAVHNNGKKLCKRITTHNGGVLKATGNHKVLEINGWKAIDDMFWKYGKYNWVKCFWMKDQEVFEMGDIEDWIIGVIYYRGRVQQYSVIVDCSDKVFADQFCDLIKTKYNMPNVHTVCLRNNWRVIITKNKRMSDNIDNAGNPVLDLIIKKCGLIKGNSSNQGFKKITKGRVFNVEFPQFPLKITLNTVVGIAESSNGLYKNRIDYMFENVAWKIFKVLQYFEIHSNIYTDIFKGKYKRTKPYIVGYKDLYDKMPWKYRKPTTEMKDIYKRVKEKCFPTGHDLWGLVVRKVYKEEECQVYDLSVENNHSYVANGMVVHNCYQEDVMKFLSDIAMYTTEEADQIRSAISKKKHDVIINTFDRIKKATLSKGWTEVQANQICEQIEAFSSYGFNKAHAAAYAELGYITMYLKHHHPLEWWTAILNSRFDDEDKIREYTIYVKNKLIQPTIKNIVGKFTISGKKIIAPISMIRGVGGKALDSIVNNAPYTSLEDFINKIDKRVVNIGVICSLIRGGAMDCFIPHIEPLNKERSDILNKCIEIQKSQGKIIKEDGKNVITVNSDKTPLELFNDNYAYNISFCQSILENKELRDYIQSKVPKLEPTGKDFMPFYYNKMGVFPSVIAAEMMYNSGFDKPSVFFLIYKNFEIRNGVSKRTGKEYDSTKIYATDGSCNVSMVLWEKRFLNWSQGDIIMVVGRLSKHPMYGYQILVDNIEKI